MGFFRRSQARRCGWSDLEPTSFGGSGRWCTSSLRFVGSCANSAADVLVVEERRVHEMHGNGGRRGQTRAKQVALSSRKLSCPRCVADGGKGRADGGKAKESIDHKERRCDVFSFLSRDVPNSRLRGGKLICREHDCCACEHQGTQPAPHQMRLEGVGNGGGCTSRRVQIKTKGSKGRACRFIQRG